MAIMTDEGKLLRYNESDKYTKLYEKGFGDFWTHKSTNYNNDYQGYLKLTTVEQHMFKWTIGYQSLMDKDVSSIYTKLVEFVKNHSLKTLYLYIAQNESIHATSYSYGLQQVFGAYAEDLLKELETNPQVLNRMKEEERVENEFKNNPKDLKAFIKTVIYTYLLEQIKFPISFYIVFKLNDRNSNALNGFTQALKEIAHDELTTHVPTNMNVIKDIRKEFPHLEEYIKEVIYHRLPEIITEELKWTEKLFEKGENYINKPLYEYLIKYFSDLALKKLGYGHVYNVKRNSDIDWFDNYRDTSKAITSQQETDSVGYQNYIVKDLDKLDGLA